MSEHLKLRPADDCRWDCVSLGEVMLRFDPGAERVRHARNFQVWEGGGEYNVAKALARTWRQRASVVTALPSNDLGWLVEDLIRQGGVDTSHILWREFDGIGRNSRVGLNFVERGFGIRPALSISDRAHSAASQIAPGDVDWDQLFGREGVRWFHTGGIFAALSASTAETALEAVGAARRHGVTVSYDLNHRASLWKAHGDRAMAQSVNRDLCRQADVLFGGDDAFAACLGLEIDGLDAQCEPLDPANFQVMARAAVEAFRNLKVVATPLRHTHSATLNDWGAALWSDGRLYSAGVRERLEIHDRVGGGDGFAAGVAHALMAGMGPQAAVDYGAALGALTMTTPGDTAMVRGDEVEALVRGEGARVIR